MRAVYLLAGLSCLLQAACTRCEPAPPYQREIGVERPAGEPCPDRAAASERLKGGRTMLQEVVLSIDSEPRREDLSSALLVCCYEGDFQAQGAAYSGKLCLDVGVPSPNDAADASSCPSPPFGPATLLYHPREAEHPLGVFGDEVGAISRGPFVDSFKPGTDFCNYTATLSSDGTVCR